MTDTGFGLWHDVADEPRTGRPPLPGDRSVDVAIVGAGYTGLWTAYYLLQRRPSLRIAILEREFAGSGASGRNGGWCSGIFPASWRRTAQEGGKEAVVRLQTALNNTVDEIGRVVEAEGIACDFQKGGYVSVARNAAQWARAQAEVRAAREWGIEADTVDLLAPGEAQRRLQASGVLGGTFAPHCAVIQPAQLVRGLARTVVARGAAIYEKTTVTGVSPGRVVTDCGTVSAEAVLVATEGSPSGIPGRHRDLVPMYSLMVATEPLDSGTWDRIGLLARETFSDKRHLRIYGQRTADGRIAFGGRGAPYHFGSRVDPRFERDSPVHAMLRHVLADLLPGLPRNVRFTHAWGGTLGVPRDWYPAVHFDRESRIGFAGGYVGDGVALSNLSARVLADLIVGGDSVLTDLPYVGRRSPRWEIEPLRWMGVNAVTEIFRSADRVEARSGQPAKRAAWFWRSIGH